MKSKAKVLAYGKEQVKNFTSTTGEVDFHGLCSAMREFADPTSRTIGRDERGKLIDWAKQAIQEGAAK